MKWLANQLEVKKCDDWYRVSRIQLSKKMPLYVLIKYPLKQLLMEAYPNHHWDTYKFQSSQERAFENPKAFSISQQNVIQYDGKEVLSKIHVGSIMEALQPDYLNNQWYQFEKLTLVRGFWNQKNQRLFMDWLGKEQGIGHLDEWYDKITQPEVLKKAKKLLRKYGPLETISRLLILFQSSTC